LLPGVHEFGVEQACRHPYFVSNSCDNPANPLPIAIFVETSAAEPVHENIRIENNRFEEGAGISAHHVKGLTIRGNRTDRGPLPLHLAPGCSDVTRDENP
jgi:hypothetical protein